VDYCARIQEIKLEEEKEKERREKIMGEICLFCCLGLFWPLSLIASITLFVMALKRPRRKRWFIVPAVILLFFFLLVPCAGLNWLFLTAGS